MFKKSDIQDIYSLSPMQEGILFHHLMDRHSTAYFEQAAFTVSGHIDLESLEIVFNKIIEKYDVLRTVFIYKKVPIPQQVVLKKRKASIHFKDISYLNEEVKKRATENFKKEDKKRGFNLTRDILIRISILKTFQERWEIILSFHHIILDGWCVGIIFKELVEKYILLKSGKPLTAEPVTAYSNYIKWLEKQDKENGLKYWENYLNGYNRKNLLQRFGKQAKDGKFKLEEYRFLLENTLTDALVKIAQDNQVTLNNVFQVIWGILLQRYNDTDDVVFGAVVSGRPPDIPGIENMVGLFINTIPVRIRTQGVDNFSQLIRKIQRETVSHKPYEYVTLAQVQARTSLRKELIDHIILFQNYPSPQVEGANDEKSFGLRIEKFEMFERSNYDFSIHSGYEKSLPVTFKYNAFTFDQSFIKKIALHFIDIVKQVVNNSNIQLGDIHISHEFIAAKSNVSQENFVDFGF